MTRPTSYLTALLLHLTVLFWMKAPAFHVPSPKTEAKYVEVTLSAAPPPSPTQAITPASQAQSSMLSSGGNTIGAMSAPVSGSNSNKSNSVQSDAAPGVNPDQMTEASDARTADHSQAPDASTVQNDTQSGDSTQPPATEIPQGASPQTAPSYGESPSSKSSPDSSPSPSTSPGSVSSSPSSAPDSLSATADWITDFPREQAPSQTPGQNSPRIVFVTPAYNDSQDNNPAPSSGGEPSAPPPTVQIGKPGSIGGGQVRPGTVGGGQIKPGAVGGGPISPGSAGGGQVNPGKIGGGNINPDKLPDGSNDNNDKPRALITRQRFTLGPPPPLQNIPPVNPPQIELPDHDYSKGLPDLGDGLPDLGDGLQDITKDAPKLKPGKLGDLDKLDPGKLSPGPGLDSTEPAPQPASPADTAPVPQRSYGQSNDIYHGTVRLSQPTEWKADPEGLGHYYQTATMDEDHAITWADAYETAIALGGYLVNIGSKAENDFVYKLTFNGDLWVQVIPGGSSPRIEVMWGPWIGGYSSSSGWLWANDNSKMSFTNWGPNEPTHRSGNQYLHFYSPNPKKEAPYWQDLGATDHTQGFIIEYDHAPPPIQPNGSTITVKTYNNGMDPTIMVNGHQILYDHPPHPAPPTRSRSTGNSSATPGSTIAPNVGSGGGGGLPAAPGSPPEPAIAGGAPVQWSVYEGGNGHYYQTFYAKDGITWADAKKYAVEQGGYLATVESYGENQFVFKQIDAPQFWTANQGKSAGHNDGPWLGAFKSAKGGWAWVNNNAKFNYKNWNVGFPDSLGSGEDSLHYYSNNSSSRSANWGASNGSALLPGFVVEYDRDPASLELGTRSKTKSGSPAGVPSPPPTAASPAATPDWLTMP